MSFWDTFKNKVSYLFQKSVVHPISKAFSGIIRYQENDPSRPELTVTMELPQLPTPCPPFVVEGFTGQDGADGTIEHQACGVYTTMALSLTQCQKTLTKPIIRWPALCQLFANPRSGKMFNAYYDRYYLNFFYDVDPKTNQMVYTCESTDVVAHELGHAILDALRPDLWSVQSVEIQAFHEAFGDINAMLTELTMKEMVADVMKETGGDLSKSNVIARIGEQMGLAIYHAKGNDGIPQNFALRSAINTFQYAPPETLPTRAPDDALAGEPHSFSRVFAGGFYDALVSVYNKEKSTGVSAEAALESARVKMSKIMYNGIRMAPVTTKFFGSVLKAMMVYDFQMSLGCGDSIKAAFAAHNIYASNEVAVNMIVDDHSAPDALFLMDNSRMETVRTVDFDRDQSDPLYSCIIELANAHQPRQFVAENLGDITRAIHAAKHSLMVIRDHDRVGNGPTAGKIHEKEFSVIDGRLVRNYFSCWFHKH